MTGLRPDTSGPRHAGIALVVVLAFLALVFGGAGFIGWAIENGGAW